MLSEFELISRYFTRPAHDEMLGVGDDCALFKIPAGQQLATSTDLLIEDCHFFSDVAPRALGHKALAVSLSDLAAMGAQPLGCLLSLAIPTINEAWIAEFAKGFFDLADLYHCSLLGGDTTRTREKIVINVTVFGTLPLDKALRRDAACVDDDIWVSGRLGQADIAYRLLSRQLAMDAHLLNLTRDALEWPQPRVSLGQGLLGLAHAAIDLSDGLLQDLKHILSASHVGAKIFYNLLPIPAELTDLPVAVIKQAVLNGGEQYELCFTAPVIYRDRILKTAQRLDVAVTCIGRIQSSLECVVVNAQNIPLTDLPVGFDHFQLQ